MLLVVIGDFDHRVSVQADGSKLITPADPPIFAAREWALRQVAAAAGKRHLHAVAYAAPSGDINDLRRPGLPVAARAGAPRRLATPTGAIALPDPGYDFAAPPRPLAVEQTVPGDCCWFSEVMIITHGTQPGMLRFLQRTLPQLTRFRPIDTLTYWACRTVSKPWLQPGGDGDFEKLMWLYRPRRCPCGCDPVTPHCNGFDPDGMARACPDGSRPTRFVAAGHYKGNAVKLGLDPGDVDHPFTTPDGRLREVRIAPDGSTSDGMVQGVAVFGAGIKPDPTLAPAGADRQTAAETRRKVESFERRHFRATTVVQPGGTLPVYGGPRSAPPCGDDGCLAGTTHGL